MSSLSSLGVRREKSRSIERVESVGLEREARCAVVPKEWFEACLSYLRGDAEKKPEPMDIACLVDENEEWEREDDVKVFGALLPKLKENLKENRDYAVVREATAEKLTNWFGAVRNSRDGREVMHVLRECVSEGEGGFNDNNNNNNNN